MKKSIKTILFLVIFSCLAILTCKDPLTGGLPDTQDGDTRIMVGIHDAVQDIARSAGNGKNIQGIEELILTVHQMVIIGTDGKQTIILDEDRTMNILDVSRSDPVILSNVSIEPGIYQELRLVLKEENTIVINGETHPIKIPSGQQSGLKLKGPFEIPKGKLFTLMIELDTDRSVSWNQGQGYRLQPVLNVSNGPEVLGVFRGYLTVVNSFGVRETLLQLYSNNTARLRIDDYPNYTLYADYDYNSVTKLLSLKEISLDAPGLSSRRINRVMRDIPEVIILPVKQWSLDSIIAVDSSGIVCNLYRVDEFDFSDGVTLTEFTLHIDYPDSSMKGKDMITEVRFIDTGMPPVTLWHDNEGTRTTLNVLVKNNSIQGSNTRIQIKSYLFNNIDNLNLELGTYASVVGTVMMTGSHISETTHNPWQPEKDIFTLIRDGNQTFNIEFPAGLDIRMNHNNFTNNYPVLSWNPYPGARGYIVLVLVSNSASEAEPWKLAFSTYTKDTSVTIYSTLLRFTIDNTAYYFQPHVIEKGTLIRAEVFALDDSGTFNTTEKTGALFMDSLMIER